MTATKLPTELPNFNRAEFEDTCKRRFLYGLGFDCYGGVAGIYDYGPVGCQIKHNFINLWRQHFVLEENMLEVDTTCLTPEEVFKTSGHTKKFTDVMVQDTVTKDLYRLDKYLEEWAKKKLEDPKKKDKLSEEEKKDLTNLMADAESMKIPEFKEVLAKHKVMSPSNNPLSEPKDFNLMFPTPIGPAGDRTGYLRPELAQGILLNFKRMLEFNGGRMPFAGAAIGTAFRNEIAPRNNLIRVREFTLAEIEHFVNPDDKSCPKFHTVSDLEVCLWPKHLQEQRDEPVMMKLGDAVEQGLIDNETLAYFIGRVKLFVHAIGIKFIRFRQHKISEMAHYACDCWDLEALTSFGWVECVGIADRSCFDLKAHGKERNTEFVAYEKYDTPKKVDVLERGIVKKIVSQTFRAVSKDVMKYLEELPEDEALKMEAELATNEKIDITIDVNEKGTVVSKTLTLTRNMVSFKKVVKTVEGRNYTPSVIEPSFGVGRLVYALLEQVYWVRREEKKEGDAPAADAKGGKKSKDDKNEKRAVFSLPAMIAPYKEKWCQDLITMWRAEFSSMGVSYKVDDGSQAIGKKYARADEIGVPFDITIDQQTESEKKVTLRERDSTKQVCELTKKKIRQIFVSTDEAATVLSKLCTGRLTWEDALKEFTIKE